MDTKTSPLREVDEAKHNVESASQQQVIAGSPAPAKCEPNDDTGKHRSTQDPSFVADLTRAFSAAKIKLSALSIPGLMEYLQANIDDPSAASSSEQLKQCYIRYICQELDSPPFCAVRGCNTSYADKYTIFSFPDCQESVKLWKQALDVARYSRHATLGQGVCELHFEEDFLIREDDDRVTLMPGAVPTNLPEPKVIKPVMKATNHCRMCGQSIKYYMQHTITDLQTVQHLRPVLDMCLDLSDSVHQLLPVTVCDYCTNMVRFIGRFADTCWKAQPKLLQHYAGTVGRKMEPWKRVYQYVVNEEIIDTGTQEPSAHEQIILEAPEELITGDTNGNETTAQAEEEPTEIPSAEPNFEIQDNPSAESNLEVQDISILETQDTPKLNIDIQNTPKPILVKTEPLEKNTPPDRSVTDQKENNDHKSNQPDPPPPSKKPRRSKEPKAAAAAAPIIANNQSEKFTCKICLLQFNKQTELVIHNRKHAREQRDIKPDVLLGGWFPEAIKCLQCRKTFPTAEELKAHTSKEHNCDAYCPICGMRFRNNDVLEQHRRRAKRCLIKPNEPSKVQ